MQDEVVTLEPVAVRRKTAAAMLDCSESTVRKLELERKLDTILVGKDRRITVASLKALGAKVHKIGGAQP
jgi:hypothetical protein